MDKANDWLSRNAEGIWNCAIDGRVLMLKGYTGRQLGWLLVRKKRRIVRITLKDKLNHE